MNSIELIVATSSVIVALSIAFIVYVLLKPRKEVKKEQVTIEANLEQYDERPALRARITFLESEIDKFATICDEMTDANKKYLDYFEAYVRLTQGEQEKPVKRSVTSLKIKECIRIGEGDWAKLAPLFEEAGIVWCGGEKASEYIPEIGNCVFLNSFGENELTHESESFHISEGFTVLPASDFIENAKGVIEEMPTAKELLEYHFDRLFEKPEPAIDWSKPVAFPEDYEIPEGVKVIKVGEDDEWIRKGSVGKTSECGSNPFIKWENQDFDLHGSGNDWAQYSHNLAPINPTDHPNHPEFKNK